MSIQVDDEINAVRAPLQHVVVPPVGENWLTALSFGNGQDSTALLYLYTYDPTFRARYAPKDFWVGLSETGDEHRHSYQHLARIKEFCVARDIQFTHITPDLGFHSPSWQSLIGFYRAHDTIGSKAYPKTCTDNLKIQPFYKALARYLREQYHVSRQRKDGFYEFARDYGKLRVLIGLSKGEESRRADHSKLPKWMQECVEFQYPLIDLGMARADCQDYIESVGHEVPYPSNCQRCPYLSEIELVWLYRFEREAYEDWVELEANKIKKFAHKGEMNYGVNGRRLLPETLMIALKKYGGWSDERLSDYKMSHGHCVKSKY